METNNNINKYAPLILRIGLAMVFLWFGMNQLLNQSTWLSLIPEWVTSLSGMTAKTVVILNGIFEVAMSVFLAFGIWIRPVAILLSIHLLMIIGDLGLTAVGVRDVGLLSALVSVAFQGSDEYSA